MSLFVLCGERERIVALCDACWKEGFCASGEARRHIHIEDEPGGVLLRGSRQDAAVTDYVRRVQAERANGGRA